MNERDNLREEKANLEVLMNANYARAKELESELARLREEREAWKTEAEGRMRQAWAAYDQRDTLLAALREIADMKYFDDADAGMAWDIARAAIAEVGGEK